MLDEVSSYMLDEVSSYMQHLTYWGDPNDAESVTETKSLSLSNTCCCRVFLTTLPSPEDGTDSHCKFVSLLT